MLNQCLKTWYRHGLTLRSVVAFVACVFLVFFVCWTEVETENNGGGGGGGGGGG